MRGARESELPGPFLKPLALWLSNLPVTVSANQSGGKIDNCTTLPQRSAVFMPFQPRDFAQGVLVVNGATLVSFAAQSDSAAVNLATCVLGGSRLDHSGTGAFLTYVKHSVIGSFEESRHFSAQDKTAHWNQDRYEDADNADDGFIRQGGSRHWRGWMKLDGGEIGDDERGSGGRVGVSRGKGAHYLGKKWQPVFTPLPPKPATVEALRRPGSRTHRLIFPRHSAAMTTTPTTWKSLVARATASVLDCTADTFFPGSRT
ncbi:hypothetical protein IWX50DRAFT_620107 [Phyllosticta citricarpa]|uniref:Uncharacterized protein n=1 Tax=Phyllosticta citricarpa TaxID=55181 RepID=A0ABR1MFF9_9PEZI